jgi:hypothetical protein
MNEDEVVDTPVEDDGSFAIDLEDLGIENSTAEDTAEPTTEEVSTPTETNEEEMDFTPLLNKLSKEVKYLDEEVKIEDVDYLKNTFQKGLDYDRKVEKLKELENSEELTYIKEKAKESGMTPTEYIKAIKDFETRQQAEQEEAEIAEMVENGVAENIARKVIETNRIAKELENEKLKLKQEQEKLVLEKQKEQENENFLRAYPEIDIKSIPKEVFVDAEKIGLIGAYAKYENAKLKQELELAKQNQKNEKTSPVKSVTEHGGVDLEQEDDFLRGFFSKK